MRQMLELYSIALTIPMALLFDLLVASNAAMPFRLIYVAAFMAIAFVVVHTSIHLLKDKGINGNGTVFNIRGAFFLLSVLINLKVIFSILWLNSPSVGFLDESILIQGAEGLLPLFEYSAVVVVNGIILAALVNRRNLIRTYEIATYVLCIIAGETFLSIYCFHIGSINGIRAGLLIFHIAICGAIIGLYYKLNVREIQLKIAPSDILLAFLSIGTFVLVYVPHGFYSMFGDTAVVIGSASSIIYRGSLQPFYVTDVYYSPIGGFVSTAFAYITGLDNILLASTIPFFISHLALPYVTYHFLKNFVTEDTRMAIMGSVMALLMDGLAVILLPTYAGNLTRPIIEWQISPATKSLYFSSIAWIWLAPFKTMGIASATALCNILPRKRTTGLLLGGVLLAFSFINPRQPFLAIFILAFLFGAKKIDLKEMAIVFSSSLILLGPVLIATVFKTLQLVQFILHQMGLIAGEISTQTEAYFQVLTDNSLAITISAIAIGFLAIVLLNRSYSNSTRARAHASYGKSLTSEYSTSKIPPMKIKVLGKKRYVLLSFPDMLFIGLSILTLVYITLYAYQYSFFSRIHSDMLVASLDYIILRYHVLMILVVMGFLGLKRSPRLLVTSAALVLITYLWIALTSVGKGITSPLILVALAIPSYSAFARLQKKIILSVVMLFILLGVLSASLYSATVTTTKADVRCTDLPSLLPILLRVGINERVFAISTYSYFSSRVVGMAHLQLTSSPSCQLYIIDKEYTSNVTIERVLENSENEILFDGGAFIFFRSERPITTIAPNLGFELGIGNPLNWTSKETDADHDAAWDETIASSGNRSLSLSVEKGSGSSWVRWESDKIIIPADISFLYLEYFVKQDLEVGSSLVQLNFYDYSGELIMYDRVWQNWDSDWTLRTSVVNFPKEFSFMTIFLVNRGEGNVWFDDLKVTFK